MSTSLIKTDNKIKMCVNSYPNELAKRLIKKFLTNFTGHYTYKAIESLGIMISTLKAKIEDNRVELILIQTTGQDSDDKLRKYYNGASGALILFLKDDSYSFDAAKRYYQNFRKITYNPAIPVAFIEVFGQSETISTEKPEILEDGPNARYYEIQDGSTNAFGNIIESLASESLTTQFS